ncbi:uncharacterized protein LOC135374589 [Ornithodoros turicata]|uniref:uncharacterized protein LOC135374589 n=1 Tax=Ornithodoros turicata TaxID=34597 RepID=UPI003139E715
MARRNESGRQRSPATTVGVAQGLNVSRVGSCHFADDVYFDEDVLQVRLGLRQKRKRRKIDAVPTIFDQEQGQEPVTEAAASTSTESTGFDAEVMAQASAGDPLHGASHKGVVIP